MIALYKTTMSKTTFCLRILTKMKFDGHFFIFFFLRISTSDTFCPRYLWVIDQLNESKFLQSRLNIKSFLNRRCAWRYCRFYLNSVLLFVGHGGGGTCLFVCVVFGLSSVLHSFKGSFFCLCVIFLGWAGDICSLILKLSSESFEMYHIQNIAMTKAPLLLW